MTTLTFLGIAIVLVVAGILFIRSIPAVSVVFHLSRQAAHNLSGNAQHRSY